MDLLKRVAKAAKVTAISKDLKSASGERHSAITGEQAAEILRKEGVELIDFQGSTLRVTSRENVLFVIPMPQEPQGLKADLQSIIRCALYLFLSTLAGLGLSLPMGVQ